MMFVFMPFILGVDAQRRRDRGRRRGRGRGRAHKPKLSEKPVVNPNCRAGFVNVGRRCQRVF